MLITRSGLLTLVLLMAVFVTGRAQDTTNTIGQVSIASPTAASLGKYGDIPVGYHTGIPQINVPIYTVRSGSLKLPIGLSYHASGLKAGEPAGWVGAGWSLNAGGAITRTVVGAPDDRGYSTSNVLAGHYTDHGFNSYLLVPGTSYFYNVNTGQTLQQLPDDVNFARGFKDGEPDLYFFNFGGYSGKFYFNDDGTPMLIPEQDFKIQPTVVSGQGFTGFVVTTLDGTRYYFGAVGNDGAVAPIEATNPFTLVNGPANTTAAASSWFLNKILSADGVDSITLSYQQENYSYYTLSTFPVWSSLYNQLGSDANDIYAQNGVNVVKNLVQGVRLSQIGFANGSITLTPAASPRQDLSSSAGLLTSNSMADNANTSAYALGSITITDNNGFCKKDSLYYGYFHDNTALTGRFWSNYSTYNIQSDAYRLRLDSIQESSCDASARVPPYKFLYFSEQVPRRLSFGIDHWGYPNGVDTNETLAPAVTQIVNNAPLVTWGAYRDAVWPAMRAGSLAQVTYPTGGYTVFDFEPKNVYTFTSSVLEEVPLKSYVIAEYTQAQLSQTLSFTVSGTGATVVTINNHSTNWSPTFSIVDANNNQQGGGPWQIGFNTSLTETINLAPGTYTGTLSYPSNAGDTLSNGADANVQQWQNVPTTTTQTVGGLRIKTISNYDGVSATPMVTSYNYTGGGSQSTGVLYSIPVYIQILRSDANKLVWGELPSNEYCSPNGCLSCDGFSQHAYFISPGSIRPMDNLQGENMGYNEVDVSQTGNGHSVYRYYGSNLWSQNITDVCQRTITQSSICDASIPSFPFPPVPYEFMRDELQYEGHFNQAGQVLKESYYFPVYKTDPLTTPGHISVNVPSLTTFTEYSLQTAAKIKDSVISTTYDIGTGLGVTTNSTVYYNSPYHHQPTRKVVSTSAGDSLISNTTYALDFRIPSCDAIPDSLAYYNNAATGDSTWLNSNIQSCSPQRDSTDNCRWSAFTQFREMMAQTRIGLIQYRQRSYSGSTNLLSTCYLNAENSADTLLLPILRLQDEYNNAPIEVSEWRDGYLKHASFSQYKIAVNPAGVVYPAKTRLVNLVAPSSSFSGAVVSGSSISMDGRYLDEALYSFSLGNPMQVTPHSGVVQSYLWDYQNKEPIAKAVNAAANQIAYTSFEADGTGNWNVPLGGRSTGNTITGTSYYNLGNGGVSVSGLNNTAVYVVSYWSNTNASYAVSGSTKIVQGKTINGWTYFEHAVTGATNILITGVGGIDELRLYPAGAQMETYTYSPLIGMTSHCDVGNRVTYYSYDALGRAAAVKDQDGNIVKTYQYHYKGQ